MKNHWEMRIEEEEERLEVEVPRNPRIPQIERNKNMKILDMLSTEVWVGGRLQIELLHEEEREHVTPTVAFNGSFITHKKGRHVPTSDLSRQQVWSDWSDML